MEWKLSNNDNKIIFLMKTLKSDFLKSTMDGGLHFRYPNSFSKTNNDLASGQIDKWDSHLSFTSYDEFFMAPIGEDGKPDIENRTVIARNIPVHLISNISEKTPICCFRKIEECDIERYGNAFRFRLGNTVDRIQTEFNGHDSFILIIRWKEFLNRIEEKTPFFARSIHYGDVNKEYIEFYNETPMIQAEMFQKDEKYSWQKEFRIILPPGEGYPKTINIGSIRDIAICGKLEKLRYGFLFAPDDQSMKQSINEINKKHE